MEPTRPSWLDEPCPTWCAAVHREDDHPEDRVHRGIAHVVAVTLAGLEPASLRPRPEATSVVVQRTQPVGGGESWIVLATEESWQPWRLLDVAGASRLARALEAAAGTP